MKPKTLSEEEQQEPDTLTVKQFLEEHASGANSQDPAWKCPTCGTINHYFKNDFCRNCGYSGPMALMGY